MNGLIPNMLYSPRGVFVYDDFNVEKKKKKSATFGDAAHWVGNTSNNHLK